MRRRRFFLVLFVLSFVLSGCDKDEPEPEPLTLVDAFIGSMNIDLSGAVTDEAPVDENITLVFSAPINQASVEKCHCAPGGWAYGRYNVVAIR